MYRLFQNNHICPDFFFTNPIIARKVESQCVLSLTRRIDQTIPPATVDFDKEQMKTFPSNKPRNEARNFYMHTDND